MRRRSFSREAASSDGGRGVEQSHPRQLPLPQLQQQLQQQQPPVVVPARTPSRTLSRNTSYDNLLRSPLVGRGIGGPVGGGPMFGGGVSKASSETGQLEGAPQKAWRWGQGGEEFFKSPNRASRGSGAWGGDDNELGASSGGRCSGSGRARGNSSSGGGTALPKAGGIRRDRDREAQQLPGTTGRTRRRVPPSFSGPSPAPRGGGADGGVTLPFTAVDPAPSHSTAAARARSFQRRSMSGGSSNYAAIAGDEASAAAGGGGGGPKLPPTTPRASGGGLGGSGDASGAPPKTPMLRAGSSDSDKLSPPGISDVTRKARKLAMMAAAAETAVSKPGSDGSQPDTQDLLALANAAAMGEKPPARAPRRGKLMRMLSHDGGNSEGKANGGGGVGAGRRLMRMASQDETARAQPGIVRANSRKKMTFRRSSSLSAAEHERRGGQVALGVNADGHGGGVPPIDKTPRGFAAAPNNAAAPAAGSAAPGGSASPMTTASPRERASNLGQIFDGSSDVAGDPGRDRPVGSGSSHGCRVAPGDEDGGEGEGGGGGGGRSRGTTRRGHRRAMTGNAPASSNATSGPGPAPPPMPTTIIMPSNDVSLGLPHSNISPLLKADRGVFPFMAVSREEEAAKASAGAEALVRDCLYNSHGMVALDGYLWKPGSIRLVKRWMMLVDNTLYYFVKPG